MTNPYREIFRAKGAKGFAAAGFVARLPIAMSTIGIVAMLSQTHGEYWLAGAVSATFALTNAVVAPNVSRLVDRYGQTRVLIPATTLSVAAFVLLLLAANQRWPTAALFAFAFLAASMPSMPAMVRARWTELFRNTPQLNTAFAFESVADELVYIAGASLSVALSVTLFPEAGLLASTLALTLGSAAFIAQTSTEPSVKPAESGGGGSAIRLRAVQIITFALIAIGAIFGAAEVTVIAFTKELGQPKAASLVLGGYAAGSFVVGLVLGAMQLKAPLARQLAVAVAITALGTIPLIMVDTVPALAVALFVSGLAISPTFITAFGLIEQRVPVAKLTEGITWVMTGIGIGMAVGSAASGWMIDQHGASAGFWVSITAGAVALSTVLLGQGVLGSRAVLFRQGSEMAPAAAE
ncbi:MFS transporter [Arvimicrobium flavum]|uniref:MFS transporter n=1 Tax=Arvimicrobium flavum TaxID=3393320 RepID=UPI00237A1DB5|nr:MFS transporter [Mesorhizobium shangrilense]